MDLQPHHRLPTASSSNTTPSQPPQSELLHFSSTSTLVSTPELRPTRSSARVKAAKQKEKERDQTRDKDSDSAEQPVLLPEHPRTSKSTPSKFKRPREVSTGKGKAKDLNDGSTRSSKRFVCSAAIYYFPLMFAFYHGSRARRVTLPSSSTSTLTINEPTKDTKGKKRAAPEADSEEEVQNTTLSSTKRTRIAPYSLRSRLDISAPSSPSMPKKTK